MHGFNRFSLTVAIGFLLSTASVRAQVRLDWAETFGPGVSSSGLAVDRAGNAFTTGTAAGSNRFDIVTVKYDSNGNLLWSATYDGPRHADDFPTTIATDSAGNVYVAGELSVLETPIDMVILKYDPAGNLVWAARYDGQFHGIESPTALSVDGAGNVYVTGIGHGLDGSLDAITVKYDRFGNKLWDALYGHPTGQIDRGNDLAVDDAGNVYVIGSSQSTNRPTEASPNTFYHDGFILKYDANGTQLWVDRYDNSNHGDDSFQAIALDANGAPLVAGWARIMEPNTFEFVTFKYEVTGARLWVVSHPTGNVDTPGGQDIEADGDGNVYVTGGSLQTLKYSPEGQLAWDRQLGGNAQALALDRTGVYVVGSVPGSREFLFDIAIVKYDLSGNLLWRRFYDRHDRTTEVPSGLALDGAGNVFVSGATFPFDYSSSDLLVLKFTQRTRGPRPRQ